jgi:hypothetical protein
MQRIVVVVRSLLRLNFEWAEFPELSSKNKIAAKGLFILKKHLPQVLKYFSKESVLSTLNHYIIELRHNEKMEDNRVLRLFKIWLKSLVYRRLIFVIVEGLVLPFSGVLALLPGPNIFFYGLFVLFYFHIKSFLALRKLKLEDLCIEIKGNFI